MCNVIGKTTAAVFWITSTVLISASFKRRCQYSPFIVIGPALQRIFSGAHGSNSALYRATHIIVLMFFEILKIFLAENMSLHSFIAKIFKYLIIPSRNKAMVYKGTCIPKKIYLYFYGILLWNLFVIWESNQVQCMHAYIHTYVRTYIPT